LEKLPRNAFAVFTAMCQPPRPAIPKVVARLGKFVVEPKTSDFPLHQVVDVEDITHVMNRQISRSRFVSLLPYASVSRMFQNYIQPKGYKLASITRKVAVHYLINREKFCCSFRLPQPTSSVFDSSASLLPSDPIYAPLPSRNIGELRRVLLLNFSRASDLIDYRLTASCQTVVEGENQTDIVKQLMETAWKIKQQQASSDILLPIPEAYNGITFQLLRYKTIEQFVSEEDGLSIKLIGLIQSEIAEGNWLSEKEFKNIAANVATNANLPPPPPPSPSPLNPQSVQWDVSIRHNTIRDKIKANMFDDLVDDVKNLMEKTKGIADACGPAFN
jgi:hypothetical protein